MRRLLTALLVLGLLAPVAARADSGASKLLIDACRDEKVDGHYTQAQYKKALEELPADSDQYTACREVIDRARLAALSGGAKKKGGGGGGSTGGGSTGSSGGGSTGASAGSGGRADPLATASPKERKAIEQAGKSAKPVKVGGKLVEPGALGLGGLAGSDNSMPASLIALIALLGAAALGGGGWWLWSRVLSGRFG
jgi:hypothetical protein